jgi:hypothetical protein
MPGTHDNDGGEVIDSHLNARHRQGKRPYHCSDSFDRIFPGPSKRVHRAHDLVWQTAPLISRAKAVQGLSRDDSDAEGWQQSHPDCAASVGVCRSRHCGLGLAPIANLETDRLRAIMPQPA